MCKVKSYVVINFKLADRQKSCHSCCSPFHASLSLLSSTSLSVYTEHIGLLVCSIDGKCSTKCISVCVCVYVEVCLYCCSQPCNACGVCVCGICGMWHVVSNYSANVHRRLRKLLNWRALLALLASVR